MTLQRTSKGGADYGDSYLKFSDPNLNVSDYFTPDNQGTLGADNTDLGSGGPMLLPGTSLLVGMGKDGIFRVISTSNMGKYNSSVDNDVQEFTGTSRPFFSSPIYWNSPNNGPVVYFWAPGDFLKGLAFTGSKFNTTPVTQGTVQNANGFSNAAALSLSANESLTGTGIIWASRSISATPTGPPVSGVVSAYDATNLTNELWNSTQNLARDDVGNYAKFNPPTVANGKVYVGSFSGQLQVYGLNPPTASGIRFVQVASTTPQSSTATASVSYPGTQSAGDLNVVVVGWNDTTSSVLSVTDSAGNSYALAAASIKGTALTQSIYYAKNIIGASSNTVTVTFNQAASKPDVRILEYSGVSSSNPLDVATGTSGNSNIADSGSVTTTAADELIIGANTITSNTTVDAGSPFTPRVITSSDSDVAEDRVVNVPGSYDSWAPLNSSGAWVMQVVTFRAVVQSGVPFVSTVSPSSGPVAGGTAVTITGTNFASGATVTFGSASATNVTVVSGTQITATTPAGSAGAVTVTVTNSNGLGGNLASGFTYIPIPTVSSVSPNSGSTSGGTVVTITGANFVGGATVKFGSAAATNVTVVSGTQITATTPAGSAGAVTVTVTNPASQSGSLSNGYTYVVQPTVTSVSPNSGPVAGGTSVTITGTNFASGATVTFGSAAATNVVVVSSTSITATTPAGSAGAVTVTVTVNGQSGSLAGGFTYGQPTVTSVSPNNGPVAGGTAVTITGTNFASGATVKFGSAAATNVTVASSTQITATTPAGSAGAVTVTVANSGGQSGSLANGFTYNASVAISFAQVASSDPQTPTATVAVTYPAAQTLGNMNVVVVGWNDTTATVQSVKDSAGNSYSLAIGPTSGTALRQSIYYAADIAGGGNTVTVTFSQAAAFPDVRILEYKGVTALDVTAGASGSSASASSGAATTTNANELIFGADMVATTTKAAGSGFTSRIITSPDSDIAEDKIGTAAGSNSATSTLTSAGPWVMQMVGFVPVSGPAPTVSSVSPNSGSTSGGTAVTITGANFASGATVTFGSASATSVTVVSGTQITATTPAGSAGAVTVTVTVNGQSGNLVNAFTYIAPPTVSTVSPSSGPVAGGTAVTITGANIATGATQTYGSASATSLTVVSGTQITDTTTAESAGALTLTEIKSNGLSGNLASWFTYIGTPTVSSVSPNSGSTSGGTVVTITGANFVGGATVKFGSAAATSVTVVNGTTITATTPAGSTGAVTVTVTNPLSQSGSLANGYTYVVKPTVSGVSPSSGTTTGGTAVTVTGTNFVTGATVTLGGAAATNVVVVSGTQLPATTPAGSAVAVTVTVTVNGQSGSLAGGFTYIGTPTVTSVSPSSGTTTGGTGVTITGTNFASGATVKFGSAAATNVVVASSTTITATTPAGSAGAVTVTVTNPLSQSGSLANGYTYNVMAAISFAQVASSDPQTSSASVSVSYPAAQTSGDMNVVVVGWNDTTATVQSVKDSAGNTYSLAIGPTSGTALRQSIYYAANIVGSSGNTVTVTFSQAAAFPDVRILEYKGVTALDVTAGASGSSASASSGAATTTNANELIFGADMVATTTKAAGSGFTSRIITSPDSDIAEDEVVTAAGSYSATSTLTSAGPWVMQMVGFVPVSGPAPTVSSVSPNSGSTSGGTNVTITGTNFASGATVTFGSASATSVTVVSGTQITATTPAGSAGAVTVTVTVNGQSGNLVNGFTYIAGPTVSTVSPSSGPVAGGTAVTITGANFATGATVTFGSASATSVTVVSGTQITATTPAGSAGAVTVTVINSNGLSGNLASGFTYIGTPTVSSVSPNSGSTSGGTVVTITGANFAGGATVTFGSAAATSVTVVTGTTITATTPAGSTGAVTVTVTNPLSQSGSLANGYTYVVKPTVSGVSPSSGPVAGGTSVTITGTNFAAGATVTFGSAAATNVVVVSGTQITATTPAGSAGAVTVTVTVNGQSGSLAGGFTYIGTPTVTSVSPSSGTTTGGTGVTITGTNFASGATVKFGSAAATNVVVVSSTTITATTPAGSAGAVTVTVTNPLSQSGSLANGYTYVVAAAISFAQVAFATPQTSSASVSVSYPEAQTLGNLNMVVVGWNDTTATVQSVKDSAGNTYKLAIGPTVGTALQQSIYYAADIAGGGNTVTVTFSQAAAFPDVRILEYRGVTALDVTAGASGNSATTNSGAATTTGANELIFGADMVATTTKAAGSGFTSRIITSPDSDIAEDEVVTAAGSYSATSTLTSAGPWVMQMVGFMPASNGPDTSPPTAPSNLTLTGPIVQTTQGYINTTFLTTHTTAPFDSTGGDLIVVCASSHAGVTMTPSDSFNNTWISAAGPTNTSTGFDLRTEVWYAKSPTVGAGHTFTLNLSAAESLVISVIVVKGSNTSSPIDQISAIGDDGGSESLNVSSPSITTTNSNDLLIGFAKSSVSETFTSGTGYTPQPVASSDFLDAETESPAMPGTYSATFTINAAATWQDVVAAVSMSAVEVNLSWNPSTDNVGVTGYLLERCQGVGCINFTQIATTTGTVYTDTGLTASTSYSYRVRATDAAGNLSNYSNILTITSPSGGGSAALATSTQVTAKAEKDPSIQDGFEKICRLETV